MKSFKQHTTEHELDREQLDEDLYKKVKIDEATTGDLLIGLGAAGGLLAMKKAWDTFGKGTKLQKKLHALNPFQTQKDKAAVLKDIEDKRKGDVEDAKAILGDPGASEKDRAKAQKTIDKKQTDDERETDAAADKERGEKERIKRGDLTDVEKAAKKVADKEKEAGDKETLAKADEIDVKTQADAQAFFDKHDRAPKGYQEYPDESGEVLDTKTVEKNKEIDRKQKEKEAEIAREKKKKGDEEDQARMDHERWKEDEKRKKKDAKEKEAADKAKKEQEDKDWSKWNYWTKKAMNPGGTADDNKKAKELEKLPHVAARVKKMRDSAGGGNARM